MYKASGTAASTPSVGHPIASKTASQKAVKGELGPLVGVLPRLRQHCVRLAIICARCVSRCRPPLPPGINGNKLTATCSTSSTSPSSADNTGSVSRSINSARIVAETSFPGFHSSRFARSSPNAGNFSTNQDTVITGLSKAPPTRTGCSAAFPGRDGNAARAFWVAFNASLNQSRSPCRSGRRRSSSRRLANTSTILSSCCRSACRSSRSTSKVTQSASKSSSDTRRGGGRSAARTTFRGSDVLAGSAPS